MADFFNNQNKEWTRSLLPLGVYTSLSILFAYPPLPPPETVTFLWFSMDVWRPQSVTLEGIPRGNNGTGDTWNGGDTRSLRGFSLSTAPRESGLSLTIQPLTPRDPFDCWETIPSGSVELINLNYLF